MSYQRPSEGRFYIWMGADGLHLMAPGVDIVFKHGAASRDNAKAMMRGLFDLLAAEGVEIKVRHGEPQFSKKDRP